jgi:hypothetical protein
MNRTPSIIATPQMLQAIDNAIEWLKEDYRKTRDIRTWEVCMGLLAIANKFEDAARLSSEEAS